MSELDASILVVSDADGSLQKSYDVRHVPLVYLVDPQGAIALRAVTNHLLDLEDALDGFARPQGNAPWVPAQPPDGAQAAEALRRQVVDDPPSS